MNKNDNVKRTKCNLFFQRESKIENLKERRAWKHKHLRLMVLHNLFSLRRCTCVKYFYLLRMNFRCTLVPVNISIPKTISRKELLQGVFIKKLFGYQWFRIE